MASQARFSTSWVRERVERASTWIERVSNRYSWIRQGLVVFFVFYGSLYVHDVVVERPFGEAFRNLEYSIIQRVLLSDFAVTTSVVNDDRRLPVVIDISPTGRSKSQSTNRPMLTKLVAKLKDMQAAAIGVDVDFSPDDSGHYIDRGDPNLFAKWMGDRIVRVGVFRRIGDSSRHWLGHPGFSGLAAGLMLPADSMYAYHYTSQDLATAHEPPPLTDGSDSTPSEPLLQLPTAIYSVVHPGDPLNFVKDPRPRPDERIALDKFPIDYSYLLKIKTIPYEKDGDLKLYERDIEGRAVFIGDTRDPEDLRTIPTEKVPVPGVMIHAAAFATMNLQLLHNITEGQSKAYEFMLFLAVWVVKIFTLGRNPAHRPSRRWNPDAMEILSAIAAAAVVVLVSTTFIWFTRFFWPGFLWIATGLFLDPYLRHITDLVVVPGLRGSVRHAGPA